MPDNKQKLGIELSLTLDSKFGDLVKQIENAFSNVDLKGFEAKVAGVESKVGKLAQEIAKVTGGVANKIQLDIDTSTVNKRMVDATKKIIEYGDVVKGTNGQLLSSFKQYSDAVATFNPQGFRNQLKEIQQSASSGFSDIVANMQKNSKRYSDAVSSLNSKGFRNELKEIRESASESFADIVNTAQKNSKKYSEAVSSMSPKSFRNELKDIQKDSSESFAKLVDDAKRKSAELNKVFSYSNVGNNFMAGLPKQGLKVFNGDVIPRTYITDMDKARDAAYKFAASLERLSEAEIKAATTGSPQGKSAAEMLTALSKQGLKVFNGDVIPKTYITDVNKAIDAAHRLKSAMDMRSINLSGNGAAQWSRDIATQSRQAEQFLRSLGKQGFEYVNGQIVATSRSATGFGNVFSNMTKHMLEFYAIRKVMFTVGAEFQTAYHTVTEFNQALHDTAAIANASNSELSKMSDAALQIATHSKFSATQVMESMKILAQAGVSASDLPAVARTADFFATGTGSSPQDAAKVLTTAMNVWDIKAEKSARITNTLTAALNVSKLEVSDLATSFNYLANQSALFGKSMEETTALIATLANQGMEASTIGTSMSQFMARLAAPTPKFKSMLKEYGIDPADISPRMHSMVQIVKTFEEAVDRAGRKGVAVEHIFQGLEARVGRGFATLVQAGSEKLELMAERITNTNSAAVAWNESMKGFNAQLNILRSEFVATIETMTGGYGNALTRIREVIQDLLVGLRTAEGQFIVFGTVAAAAIYGIWTAWNAHPIGRAITLALLGISGVMSALGRESRVTASQIEATTKAISENAAAHQRKSDAMYTALGLMDKTKVTQEGYLVIEDKNKKQLQQIINTYPSLFKSLDVKKQKYDDVTAAISRMNKEQSKELTNNINSYNAMALKVSADKRAVDRAESEEKKNTEGLVGLGFKKLATARAKARLKESESALSSLDSVMSGNSQAAKYFNTASGTYLYKTAEAEEEKPKPSPVPPIDPTAEKDAAKLAKREGASIAQDAIELKQSNIKRRESELADAKEKLKNDQDLLDFQKKSKELIEEKYALLDEEDAMAADKKTASHTGGILKFDDAGKSQGVFVDPTVKNPGDQRVFIQEEAARQKEWLEAQRKLRAQEKQTELDKMYDTKLPSVKLNSDYVDKQEDKKQRYLVSSLAIAKDLAHTAQEVNDLEAIGLENLIETNKSKQAAYLSDLQALSAKAMIVGLDETEKTKLEEIRGKYEEIDDLIKSQQRSLADTTNQNFWYNFGRGVDTANKNLGTFKSNTNQLGENVASTLENGMVGVLQTSIDKLAQLKWSWKDFASSLGNIMKDIAKELETYLAKLLVIWSVQQLMGMFGGTTPSGNFGEASGAGSGLFTGNLGGGGTGNFSGIFPKADGGQIPLNVGVPGVDSVPAMLTPGEIVIQKSTVDYYGADKLLALNDRRLKGFAAGGLVGNRGAGSTNDGEVGNLTIINVADASSIPPAQPNETQIVNIVSFAMNKNAAFKQQIKNVAQGR